MDPPVVKLSVAQKNEMLPKNKKEGILSYPMSHSPHGSVSSIAYF